MTVPELCSWLMHRYADDPHKSQFVRERFFLLINSVQEKETVLSSFLPPHHLFGSFQITGLCRAVKIGPTWRHEVADTRLSQDVRKVITLAKRCDCQSAALNTCDGMKITALKHELRINAGSTVSGHHRMSPSLNFGS